MLVFLLLLVLAVQVLYNLYATSVVTAAAYDGARLAAGFDSNGDPQGRSAADAHVRLLLGDYGREHLIALHWREDEPGWVVLHVRAKNPGFLPKQLRAPLGLDEVDRTVRVRIEEESHPEAAP